MKGFPFDSQKVQVQEDGSISFDRAIDSVIYRKLFSVYFTNGIFYNIPDCLAVKSGTGMQLTLKKGFTNVNGILGYEETDTTVNIETASSQDRIDRIVVRADDNVDVRAIEVKVIKGTPSSSPQAPALTRNETVWELCLAEVKVKANTTSITQADITDTRLLTDLCGIVTVLDGVDTTGLYDQYQDALNQFLETVASALDETLAGNLQNQITALDVKTTPIINQVTIQPSQWQSGVYTYSNSLIQDDSVVNWFRIDYDTSKKSMFEAIDNAQIESGGKSVGVSKIVCRGNVPTVAITVNVMITNPSQAGTLSVQSTPMIESVRL